MARRCRRCIPTLNWRPSTRRSRTPRRGRTAPRESGSMPTRPRVRRPSPTGRSSRSARRPQARPPAPNTPSCIASTAGAPPPGGSAPRAELAELHRIAGRRSAAGTTAANWLESHGKKQPWKVFRKQDKAFLSAQRYDAVKRALNDAFGLGGKLQAIAKQRYDRRSPYQADPSLHGLNQAKFAGQSRQSYPSKHTVYAGAGTAVLGRVAPHLVPEFDWFTDEIAYARLYGAGHYPSDLTAGVYLGTLIGDYEARKNGLTS